MLRKILFYLAAITVIGGIFLPPYFVKVKVECKSQYGVCPEELRNDLVSLNGKSYKFVKKEITSRLKKNASISDFSMQFKLPNTLDVNVLLKKPEFAIGKQGENKLFLSDIAGNIISVGENVGLPVVLTDNFSGNVGSKVTDTELTALKLMSGVNEMYQVRQGVVQNDALVVELPTHVRVIFPLSGDHDPEVLLGGLRLIYSKISSDGGTSKYSEIDMRYRNPVLR